MVPSGMVTPISQVSASWPTRMFIVPSSSSHQTGVGAGADLERAPLSPVRILDARERPEFISGGPDVQLPRLALKLDRSGVTGIIAGLDSHVHHGLIVAAATTRDKPDPAQPTSVASRAQTMCHSYHGA
jgi:hypothetical protein